jgi:hypothetical protein
MARKAMKATVMAVVLLFVGIWVVMTGEMTEVWLTVAVFGLLMLSRAVVASLLVAYFDWRPLLNQIRDERYGHRRAA